MKVTGFQKVSFEGSGNGKYGRRQEGETEGEDSRVVSVRSQTQVDKWLTGVLLNIWKPTLASSLPTHKLLLELS